MSGNSTSAMTSGFLSSTRIAAFLVLETAIAASLVEVDEGIVTRVAGLPEPPFPLFRRIERLAGHLPLQQIRLLGLVAVGLDAEVPAFANALHLAQRAIEIVAVQVMQGVERVDQIEGPVRPGELAGGANPHAIPDLVLGVRDRVLRDVDPVDFDARHHLRPVEQHEALAATHVEDLTALLDAVMLRHDARDFLPAALEVAISAVVDASVPVPVVIPPLLRELRGLGLRILRVVDPGEIVALRALVH